MKAETEKYIRKQIPTMVGEHHVSEMKLTTLIGLLQGYIQQSTLSESKVMEVLENGTNGTYWLTSEYIEKIAKQICSLSVVDIAQVGEGAIVNIMQEYLSVSIASPTANHVINGSFVAAVKIKELFQSLGSERSTQPAAVSEGVYVVPNMEVPDINYQQDESGILICNSLREKCPAAHTATIHTCKGCLYIPSVANVASFTISSNPNGGEEAQERYDKANKWLSKFMDNSTSDYRNFIKKAIHIAAGLPPKPEGGKDE